MHCRQRFITGTRFLAGRKNLLRHHTQGFYDLTRWIRSAAADARPADERGGSGQPQDGYQGQGVRQPAGIEVCGEPGSVPAGADEPERGHENGHGCCRVEKQAERPPPEPGGGHRCPTAIVANSDSGVNHQKVN